MLSRCTLWAAAAVAMIGFYADVNALEITNFTGGDPGEGLDLQGDFAYALDISGDGGVKVSDVNFTYDDDTPGFTVEASHTLTTWRQPEYGDTENDDNLEYLMSSIRWSDVNSAIQNVAISMDVQAGQKYKLQMLFTESCCNRGFDILLEDNLLFDDFVIYDYHFDTTWGIASREDGVLMTHEFTAADNQLTLNLGQDAPDYPDNNGHISAITLERLAAALPGDFNANNSLDAADIDLLSAEVRAATNKASFDLNADAKVDGTDRTVWVNNLKKTYFGDANLDREFNSGDFVAVFTVGKYETGASALWQEGDWDGNGKFDSGDFVTAFTEGGYEKGPHPAVNGVPEPSAVVLFALGLIGLIRRRRGGK